MAASSHYTYKFSRRICKRLLNVTAHETRRQKGTDEKSKRQGFHDIAPVAFCLESSESVNYERLFYKFWIVNQAKNAGKKLIFIHDLQFTTNEERKYGTKKILKRINKIGR